MDTAGSINNDAIIESVENEEEIIDDSEERELVTDSCSTKVLDAAEEPRDRYRIVYFLFLLFGVTSLVPYNFLITANEYWMYKFREVHPNITAPPPRKTQFQAEFTSYLNVATAVPNLLFLIANSMYGHFRFSPEYMSAVVSGQSLGGIVAALAQIISLAFKISPQHSALIYFIIADVLVISSLVSLKIWVYAFSIFAVFAISQAVYPAVTVLPRAHLPVVFIWDYEYILIMI
ncbi:Equilibrative nucleoside transporter 3, partial [Operophtera brumata]